MHFNVLWLPEWPSTCTLCPEAAHPSASVLYNVLACQVGGALDVSRRSTPSSTSCGALQGAIPARSIAQCADGAALSKDVRKSSAPRQQVFYLLAQMVQPCSPTKHASNVRTPHLWKWGLE
jgi:hypothetical protein